MNKSKRGGRRSNPGGRPQREVPGIRRQFVIDEDLSAWLDSLPNKSAFLNKLIRDFIEKNKLV